MLEDIATKLQADNPTVVKSQMFGMPTLKVGSKAFAGEFGADMVFKLSGDAHEQAARMRGAHLFDPMGGRPMKEWVVVPAEHQATWLDFARAALHYVESTKK